MNLSTGTRKYLVADALGSVRAVVNTSGTVVATASYDVYGTPNSGSNVSGQTPFGYAGGYTDPSGLIYLIGRYYDPSTGQFLSVDPLVDETDQPYAYTGGDPVNGTDPSGDIFSPTAPGGNCLNVGVQGTTGCTTIAELNSLLPSECSRLAGSNFLHGVSCGTPNPCGESLFCSLTALAEVELAGSGAPELDGIGTLFDGLTTACTGSSVAAEDGASADLPGYNSFSAAKADLGSPGPGNVFDHVVEQSQIGRSDFAPEDIHNPFNLDPVDAQINHLKANYYSSIRPFTGGQTVRDWLTGQSFADQYNFGMDINGRLQNGLPLP